MAGKRATQIRGGHAVREHATGPVTLMERYALAIGSDNLLSASHTARSDADLLTGMGCAARRLAVRNDQGWSHAGADAMARVMAGDCRAIPEAVDGYASRLLEESAFLACELSEARARAIVKACLAWLVAGTCKACDGRKVALAPESTLLTSAPCSACGGTGKVSFKDSFLRDSYVAGKWVASMMINDLKICEDELSKFVALEG